MPRRNLSAGLGRLVTNTLKLFNKLLNPVKTPRPRTPRPHSTAYESEMQELKRQVEEQRAEIERLKAELMEKQRPVVTEVKADIKKPKIEQESEPEDVPLPFEVDLSDYEQTEEIEPPFEIIDDTTPQEESYTFDDLGSKESLDFLTNFLKDTELSGISPDSPFFNMSAIQQQFILIDYVQYQHDANPSLFYEGKQKVDLVNVPIWGAEFDRFIDNMADFGNTNTGDGRFDDALPDWVSDLIEEY